VDQKGGKLTNSRNVLLKERLCVDIHRSCTQHDNTQCIANIMIYVNRIKDYKNKWHDHISRMTDQTNQTDQEMLDGREEDERTVSETKQANNSVSWSRCWRFWWFIYLHNSDVCKAWSLALKEWHGLCLRSGCWGEYLGILRSKDEKVTGGKNSSININTFFSVYRTCQIFKNYLLFKRHLYPWFVGNL
jgi:hypothetical protein